MTFSSGCLICGSDLLYADPEQRFTCSFCGKSFSSNACCTKGHYICDACHAGDALEVIFRTCLDHTGTDPIALAHRIMHHPSVKMHGPEHHYLVPAVLLSCYYNLKKRPGLKKTTLESARKRASSVPGGFCGTHGNCGAAVGSGIFISLILGSTPLKTIEWKHSNMMTALALTEIAIHGGPRCCKRDSWLAIGEAVKYLGSELGFSMPVSKPGCDFTDQNRECLKEGCTYYEGRGTKDVGRRT